MDGSNSWGADGVFNRGENGSFTVELYFNADWNTTGARDEDGFTLYITAEPIAGDGMQTLSARVIKHKPYLLEQTGEIECFALSTERYSYAEGVSP